MSNQLLQRQTRLLEHLTGRAGIFGVVRGLSNEPLLQGLDLGLLHLEARFSHEKRMQKIEWVLSHTLELLGDKRAAIIHDFVEACPPASITWLDNARQFHAFLQSRWMHEAAEPAWLPDVAAYELAYATVRAGERRGSRQSLSEVAPGSMRLHPSALLLHCAYDIRCILEGRDDELPAQTETHLVVAMPPDREEPFVSVLSPPIFDILQMLDEFVAPATLAEIPGLTKLLAELAATGLIEART
jgi:hypothetical protein